MNAAFLFNSDDPKFGGYYGPPIRNAILSSEILQNSNRHLKVSIGDVLIYSHSESTSHYIDLAEKIYFWHPWQELFDDRIRSTYLNATVYAWVIQNITSDIAKKIHESLINDSSYLGMHALDFSYPFHLVFYRNLMIPKYRIYGHSCNLFFSMGEEDSKDEMEFDAMLELGFENVAWEDNGARKTIFDDFDTLEHFQQIEEYRRIIISYLSGEDEADELIMLMEDLNPRLFNTLGAAVRALSRAQTEEDFAHIGLSGRRYLEQLADVVFPAQDELYNGKDVTKNKFKNRLWAYIDASIQETDSNRETKIQILGKEVDRLFGEVNSILHADSDKEKAIQVLIDLTKFSITLISLDLEKARKPYYAFEQNIRNFFKEAFL